MKLHGSFAFLASIAVLNLGPFDQNLLAQSGTGPGGTPTNIIPVVTIEATDPNASENGDPGIFTVNRKGNPTNALNVFYQIGGTASNGVDYATIPQYVLIPAFSNSAQIVIKPLDDSATESNEPPVASPGAFETVVLHLAQPPTLQPINYSIGSPDTATVLIQETNGSGTNIPPTVKIASPSDGSIIVGPTNINLSAATSDPDGTVTTVAFFENGSLIGVSSNYAVLDPLPGSTPPGPVYYFFLTWSNVAIGDYTLTAVATDNGGATGTSGPVRISVVQSNPNTNPPPIVTIFATDPIASERTNCLCYVPPATTFARYCHGTNTATFLVRRISDTNSDLTVTYAIGGTASNGVDYMAIPNQVTIPAGSRYALITIDPLEDIDPIASLFSTVLMKLQPSTNAPPDYVLGWPAKAGAVIFEECGPPFPPAVRPRDHCFHANWPAVNGMNYCVQYSTNLIDWISICTNTVVKRCIEFVDPEAVDNDCRYYRVVPAASAPDY